MDYEIPEPKVVNYLLTNPVKCRFFTSFGYSLENWTQLRDDLLNIARSSACTLRRRTPYGDEYEIVGAAQAPNGRVICVRTGWMIRRHEPGIMAFVTAYPA